MDGEVRVWLNENFALNHPATERPELQITSTILLHKANSSLEKTMVDNIIQVVERRT